MKEILFKQRTPYGWHYWGYIDDMFTCPANSSESFQHINSKDKNGVKIFEGDKVKSDTGVIGEIVFVLGSFCIKTVKNLIDFYDTSKLTVI